MKFPKPQLQQPRSEDVWPRARVKAQRAYLSRLAWGSGKFQPETDAEVAEVEVVLVFEPPGEQGSGPSPTIYVEEGGPTGYERIYVWQAGVSPPGPHGESTPEQLAERGWCACAGTPSRWDKLFIPPASMAEALRAFELLPPLPEKINPRWAAWERAGAPKPSPDFPKAGAFMLWNDEQWRAFERVMGRPAGSDLHLWRNDNAELYDRWLDRSWP